MNNYWMARFSGPLAPYVDDLRAEFSAMAYAPSTVSSHMALWAQLSGWLERRGMDPSELTAAGIEEFWQSAAGPTAISTRSGRCLRGWSSCAGWGSFPLPRRWRRSRPWR